MANNSKLRFPTTVHFYPTMRCPLNCSYCYVEDVNKDRQELELSTYFRLIDESLRLGANTFDIAGGEPFFWAHLIPLLQVIKARSASSRVVTSGLLLHKYFDVFEKEHSLISELHVSLDSADPHTHDTTRGYKGLHQKVIANVQKYVKRQLGSIIINYVLQRGTFTNLESMLDFVVTLGVEGIDIQCMVDVSSKTRESNFSLTPAELMASYEIITNWIEHSSPEHFRIQFVVPGYMFPFFSSRDRKCQKPSRLRLIYFPGLLGSKAFSDALFIKHNGDVTGSTTFINNDKWFIGNVATLTLEEIWNNSAEPIINKIKKRSRDLMSQGVCMDCKVRRFCQGGDPEVFSCVDLNQYCVLKEQLHHLTLCQEEK